VSELPRAEDAASRLPEVWDLQGARSAGGWREVV